MEKIFHANGSKKLGKLYLSDKVNFKTKTIKRDKAGNYIMIKSSVQQEDVTAEHIYTCNSGAPKYIEEILTDTKREIDNNIIIVEDFFASFTLLHH